MHTFTFTDFAAILCMVIGIKLVSLIVSEARTTGDKIRVATLTFVPHVVNCSIAIVENLEAYGTPVTFNKFTNKMLNPMGSELMGAACLAGPAIDEAN